MIEQALRTIQNTPAEKLEHGSAAYFIRLEDSRFAAKFWLNHRDAAYSAYSQRIAAHYGLAPSIYEGFDDIYRGEHIHGFITEALAGSVYHNQAGVNIDQYLIDRERLENSLRRVFGDISDISIFNVGYHADGRLLAFDLSNGNYRAKEKDVQERKELCESLKIPYCTSR